MESESFVTNISYHPLLFPKSCPCVMLFRLHSIQVILRIQVPLLSASPVKRAVKRSNFSTEYIPPAFFAIRSRPDKAHTSQIRMVFRAANSRDII